VGNQEAQGKKPSTPPKAGPALLGPKQVPYTKLYTLHGDHYSLQDRKYVRTRSEPKTFLSGRMKLHRQDYVESPDFTMYAIFGEASIAVDMELNPEIGRSSYPSHLAFRPGPSEQWVLELQWADPQRKVILGTLELQETESAPGQRDVVNFYWRTVDSAMCRQVNLQVNDFDGWDTGVVLKSPIGR
jgi:hypothetical protein